jgi:hypothetical protein
LIYLIKYIKILEILLEIRKIGQFRGEYLMMSIISVYNDRSILERYLLKSLEIQNVNFELILLNNSNGQFKSAAEALNSGVKNSNGDYLMFVHQDFDLISAKWLEHAEKVLDNLKNIGVAGVVGRKGRTWISNIKSGITPVPVATNQIQESKKAQTLDECLIIVPKKIFEEIQFDEVVCDNWHLYATEYCLNVQKAGYDVYVIPLGGYHVSPGYSFSPEAYYSTLKKVVTKYKGDYKWIYTSTGSWSTFYPLFLQITYQKLYYWLGFE